MAKDFFKNNYYIPSWEELPNIDLYLDQVVSFVNGYLKNYSTNSEEEIVTKTMINNYVKQGVLDAPIKKKYNQKNIAMIFVIGLVKQVYSINATSNLIQLCLDRYESEEKAYNAFCYVLEKSINTVFDEKEFEDDERTKNDSYILKKVVLSCANKLYVEKKILKKK